VYSFKKLIFILRDYDDSENQDTIKNTIRQDIYKIWGEINKVFEYLISQILHISLAQGISCF